MSIMPELGRSTPLIFATAFPRVPQGSAQSRQCIQMIVEFSCLKTDAPIDNSVTCSKAA